MNERLKRAIAHLRDQRLLVATRLNNDVCVSASDDGQEYILTHGQLLELMDNDQLTWLGIKELQRALGANDD